MAVIVRVFADDWEGLYVDGVLKVENHNLGAVDIFKALDIEYENIEISDDLIHDLGRFPLGIGQLRHMIERKKNGDHSRWEDEGGSVVG